MNDMLRQCLLSPSPSSQSHRFLYPKERMPLNIVFKRQRSSRAAREGEEKNVHT